MHKSIRTSEATIDRALDLIRRHTHYKKEAHLLVALQEKYNKTIRQPDLSKSKTLQKGKHGYEKRKGDDWVSVEKRQEIADALCHVLLTEADIVFKDGLFRRYETNEIWGELTETSNPKRPRPGFEPTFIPVAYEEIFEAIKMARKVRVLHTYINATEIFCNNCEKAILKNGCTFEIMLLEPFCDALRLRIKGLLNTLHWGENIESKSKENYRALSALANKYPKYFTFRTYNEIPGFTFYQIDQKIYIGLQWYQKQSHGV